MSITDGVYLVQLVDSGYEPVASWSEFWAQETPQSSLTFTLDDTSSEGAGAYAGPYRACPYGAESSRFEYDIRFPGGLGYLQDNGTFRDLTVTLEIGYRRAGSDDAWTTETKTFTAHTNDELAYTYTLETETPGNYEFRIRNVSEANNSTRALDEVKWVGLKSVISTVNQYDGITVMIGRFRGTETLSELSGNQLATYWTRKLPDISTGVLTATRDIAPAVKYIVNSSKYAGIIDNVSLAEYDALPGYGELSPDGSGNAHACGHNWISAAAYAAAVTLKQAVEEAEKKGERRPVRILLVGTPAEETWGGKISMCREGLFRELSPDAVFEAHLSGQPKHCFTNYLLALTNIRYTFRGKASHASAHPENGINALDALNLTFAGIACLRQHVLPGTKLHGKIVEGGLACSEVRGVLVPDSVDGLLVEPIHGT